MRVKVFSLICVVLLSFAVVASAQRVSNAELKKQVTETERSFAATMKARDFVAFTRFLSEDAVFFGGHGEVLRGKKAVAEAWKGMYIRPDAPFSWEPDQVEVLDSGTLALSSGPVYDPKGKLISRFSSVWRLEAPGTWRIVFDKGTEVCDCKKGEPQQP
jgi:ketosteroid isomerase-like protein